MKTCTKLPHQDQPISDPPLFNWRIVAARPNTMARCFLVRRYRVDPAVADVIANLAGIGVAEIAANAEGA